VGLVITLLAVIVLVAFIGQSLRPLPLGVVILGSLGSTAGFALSRQGRGGRTNQSGSEV
jgi:hypothetical protein